VCTLTSLSKALQAVKDLEDKLLSLEQADIGEAKARNGGKEIRIWMDGAFDMMHYGERRFCF
jgi:ethanolamine-phosphate cytidylyltransferase